MMVRILWGGILMFTFAFLVIRLIVPAATQAQPVLLPVLGVVALSLAIVSVVLPARTYQVAVAARKKLPLREVSDTSGSDVIPAGFGPMKSVFVDPDAAIGAAFATFQTPFILGLALSEAVSICGFVLGQLGFGPLEYLPFFVVSWVLIGMRFPTVDKVLGPFERAQGAVIAR